jgi:predicted house-cleaning noncanonical NTP pyrophosphatase (MazG superfamily)
MRVTYNKLVRDRIPEIIRANGKSCQVNVMSEEEYRLALAEKLVEEAREVAEAGFSQNTGDLAKELADLQETIDALLATYKLDIDTVRELKTSRRKERGGFENRYRLIWVQ